MGHLRYFWAEKDRLLEKIKEMDSKQLHLENHLFFWLCFGLFFTFFVCLVFYFILYCKKTKPKQDQPNHSCNLNHDQLNYENEQHQIEPVLYENESNSILNQFHAAESIHETRLHQPTRKMDRSITLSQCFQLN
jgi:hypothetical protein